MLVQADDENTTNEIIFEDKNIKDKNEIFTIPMIHLKEIIYLMTGDMIEIFREAIKLSSFYSREIYQVVLESIQFVVRHKNRPKLKEYSPLMTKPIDTADFKMLFDKQRQSRLVCPSCRKKDTLKTKKRVNKKCVENKGQKMIKLPPIDLNK